MSHCNALSKSELVPDLPHRCRLPLGHAGAHACTCGYGYGDAEVIA